jgi:hypothetical protein
MKIYEKSLKQNSKLHCKHPNPNPNPNPNLGLDPINNYLTYQTKDIYAAVFGRPCFFFQNNLSIDLIILNNVP